MSLKNYEEEMPGMIANVYPRQDKVGRGLKSDQRKGSWNLLHVNRFVCL